MSFLQYLKEAFSQWDYKVPTGTENVPQLIYDFYALNLMEPSRIDDEVFSENIKLAKEKIVDYTYKFFQMFIPKACIVEMIHFQPFWSNRDISDRLSSDEQEIFLKLKTVINPLGRRYDISRNPNYIERYKLIKSSGLSDETLLKFCQKIFSFNHSWHSTYGGKAWQKIAKYGMNLFNGNKDTGSKTVTCDLMFDLAHNSGSIFTKDTTINLYKVIAALEFKKHIKNYSKFYDVVSYSLQAPFASYMFKTTGLGIDTIEQQEIDEKNKKLKSIDDMINNLSKENFDGTELINGSTIHIVEDDDEWSKLKTPAMCYYNNDKSKGTLYNWYAVKELKVPSGWRVPTDGDWKKLDEIKNIKKTDLNLNYGGCRYGYGTFYDIGYNGYWWSTTERSDSHAWYRYQDNNNEELSRSSITKSSGFSVRLVRDL